MVKKKPNFIKAIVFGAIAFILMSLFWKFLGSLTGHQPVFMAWAWNVARKLTTWGFAILAFIGGLE